MNDAHSASVGDAIGTVDFQADCDNAVRADVDHALGMMHHMMYTQAREEFEAVVQADPGCAMAHWGVATTLFQPLWGPARVQLILPVAARQSVKHVKPHRPPRAAID